MKQIRLPLFTFLTLSLISLWNSSCKKEINDESKLSEEPTLASGKYTLEPGFADDNMVMYWNDKFATVLSAGVPQPHRTRYFAMLQIAVHDALNNIKPKYERYALTERTQHANPNAAVASAAYWAIKGLNRQGTFPVDAWYDESLATIPDGESKELGKILGKHSADAIIAKRANDGFTQITLSSTTPPNGSIPGEYRSTVTAVNWVPTQTLSLVRTLPNWGTVMKPYILESNQQFRPVGPYSVNSPEYTLDFNEVKIKGARVNGIRSEEELKIAQFWSEGRPSLMWNNLARLAIRNKKLDAWKTARLLALIQVCIAECMNTQFNASYYYYSWRPETAIRLAGNDGNDNTAGDESWLPFISENPISPTPPVPASPNGWTAFGGATAQILRLFFGSDETFIEMTTTSANPAIPSPKPSFRFFTYSQAARDNSLSMIYNGWDFRKSALDGEEMGRKIADYVFNHSFKETVE